MFATSNAPAENNSSSTLKNHSNVVSQKENENSPEIKLKVMEDYHLTDREFKTTVMKKLNKLQESSEIELNKLRNEINEEKKYFTKDLKTSNRNSGAENLNK